MSNQAVPEPLRSPCSVHGAEPSVTVCAWCGRGLCRACYRFDVGDRPACVLCAREIATRRQRRVSLAVVVGLLGTAGATYVGFRAEGQVPWVVGAVGAAGLSIALSLWIGRTGRLGDATLALREREADAEVVLAPAPIAAHPYRAAARRVLAAASPKLSGGATATVVATALLLAALAVPGALHLPRWIETEALLTVIYFGLAAALSVLLYRGYRIEDDHRFVAPAVPWRDVDGQAPRAPRERSARGARVVDGCSGLDGCGDAGGCLEGCAGIGDAVEALPWILAGLGIALAAVGAAAGVVLFSWLLVEVALPLLFLAFYEMLLFALRRVTNDRHGCRGDRRRSILHALIWSAVAVTPVAALTYLLHRLMHPGAG